MVFDEIFYLENTFKICLLIYLNFTHFLFFAYLGNVNGGNSTELNS